MSNVRDLQPGDRVVFPAAPHVPINEATYVAQTDHPLYPGLRLVIWRLEDRSWSHDALSPDQYVGEATTATPDERKERLRAALLGGP